MKKTASAVVVLALAYGGWSGARAQSQSEITLLAVGPMRAATQKIVAGFQAKTGRTVKVTFGNGAETRRTVARGQGLDVSLIIAPFPGALSSGTIVLSSATPVTSILTAVGVPKGRPKPDISTPAAVKSALLAARRIGYEDPDFTVAGQGPWEALTTLGIADQVAGKSEVELGPGAQGLPPDTTRNSVKTATRLANGDIDIGMLMLSDMVPDKEKYDIVGVLPRSISTPVAVVGFISTRASDPAGARALLDYLAASEAQAIWKEAGFGPPER
ncbi:MAG: substrate-binding domain-containing protein [Acidobacteria bacterium]|nr:substrate-binding domain-containing protein [Acidobacteriota bacterium]